VLFDLVMWTGGFALVWLGFDSIMLRFVVYSHIYPI
jgi:hypothetical protein